jgi:hypothetical protein
MMKCGFISCPDNKGSSILKHTMVSTKEEIQDHTDCSDNDVGRIFRAAQGVLLLEFVDHKATVKADYY